MLRFFIAGCSFVFLCLPVFASDYNALLAQLNVLERKYAAKEIDREAVLLTLRQEVQREAQKDANTSLLLHELLSAQQRKDLNLSAFRNRLATLSALQRRRFQAQAADRKRLNEILARPEFVLEEEPGVWDLIARKIIRWLQSFFAWLPVGDQLQFVSHLIMTIALAGLTALLIYLILRFTRKSPPAPELSPSIIHRQPMLQRPQYYTQLAEAALKIQDYRSACRHYFYAILSSLHHAGMISYQPSRTNWEYWRNLRTKSGDATEADQFQESVRSYEKLWYGKEDADAQAVRSFQTTTRFFLEKLT